MQREYYTKKNTLCQDVLKNLITLFGLFRIFRLKTGKFSSRAPRRPFENYSDTQMEKHRQTS